MDMDLVSGLAGKGRSGTLGGYWHQAKARARARRWDGFALAFGLLIQLSVNVRHTNDPAGRIPATDSEYRTRWPGFIKQNNVRGLIYLPVNLAACAC
jgi:hypothetical protein